MEIVMEIKKLNVVKVSLKGGINPTDVEMEVYVFPNGRTYPKTFVDGLIARINEQVPDLDDRLPLSLRRIVGKKFMAKYSRSEAIVAGCCVSLMVKLKMVPLLSSTLKNGSKAALYYLD